MNKLHAFACASLFAVAVTFTFWTTGASAASCPNFVDSLGWYFQPQSTNGAQASGFEETITAAGTKADDGVDTIDFEYDDAASSNISTFERDVSPASCDISGCLGWECDVVVSGHLANYGDGTFVTKGSWSGGTLTASKSLHVDGL